MNTRQAGTRTAWGDAEGRRRDILAAAERILRDSGYPALTMRAIASGAGVSSGTVYQYFGGKDEVFVALMARRLEALRDTLDDLEPARGIAGVLDEALPQVTELWKRLGRSAPQWEAKVLAADSGDEGLTSSAKMYRHTIESLGRALAEGARAEGRTLVDDPALPFWVWDCLIGLADDLLQGGARHSRIPRRGLIEFATAAIERGIVTSG